MKILMVGGNWDTENGRASSVFRKIYENLKTNNEITYYNGGSYDRLTQIYNSLKTDIYEAVFWFANVPNDLPKIRDVKEIQPFTMLISSKRNNGEYTQMEVVQRALAQKANLLFEFSKENDLYKIKVIDPLGCIWADSFDINEATAKAFNRLIYLKNITRQKTIKDESKNIPEVTDQNDFIKIIRDYANIMQTEILPMENTQRFLGNASMKVKPVYTRCSKTMPSFRKDDVVFVSRRNVPKQFIELSDFVPIYLNDNNLYYYGDNKPSVDSPIQIRIYEKLPNIRYMIHFHAYIESAPYTDIAVPCGGLEEVDEVIKAIDKEYGSRDKDLYTINLRGHGAIIMASTVDQLKNYKLIKRPMPELV